MIKGLWAWIKKYICWQEPEDPKVLFERISKDLKSTYEITELKKEIKELQAQNNRLCEAAHILIQRINTDTRITGGTLLLWRVELNALIEALRTSGWYTRTK